MKHPVILLVLYYEFMFKVSTKGDYGLLLMQALGQKFGEGYISLKEIAQQNKISFPYLSQIVLSLKDSGLVESKEGIHGGYKLAKNPAEISLIEILEALEGKVAPVKCCSDKNDCESEAGCGMQSTWSEATNIIKKFLASKTLAHVIAEKNSAPITFIS